jgi:hypothetical protein
LKASSINSRRIRGRAQFEKAVLIRSYEHEIIQTNITSLARRLLFA